MVGPHAHAARHAVVGGPLGRRVRRVAARRLRAARGCVRHQRPVPARLGGELRRAAPHRPGARGRPAWASRACRTTCSTPTTAAARSSPSSSRRWCRSVLDLSRMAQDADPLVHAGVRLLQLAGRALLRLEHHAAEEESLRPGEAPFQGGLSHRRALAADAGAPTWPALGLQSRRPGQQGAVHAWLPDRRGHAGGGPRHRRSACG